MCFLFPERFSIFSTINSRTSDLSTHVLVRFLKNTLKRSSFSISETFVNVLNVSSLRSAAESVFIAWFEADNG